VERVENVDCMFLLTDHDNMAAAPCRHVFDFVKTAFCIVTADGSRSQWPRGLRGGSAAARLLGLCVRITMGAWMMSVVSVVCCKVEVSASD
jgi:hypothetical protein